MPIADRSRNGNALTIPDTGGLIRKETVAFVANEHEAERSSGWNPCLQGRDQLEDRVLPEHGSCVSWIGRVCLRFSNLQRLWPSQDLTNGERLSLVRQRADRIQAPRWKLSVHSSRIGSIGKNADGRSCSRPLGAEDVQNSVGSMGKTLFLQIPKPQGPGG